MTDPVHDAEVARAFDGQAAAFERSPVQSNREALERLVRFAGFRPGAHVLDAGCGPGLVCEALLEAGHRVTGADLSAEMVRRAEARCARFGPERARFIHGSALELRAGESFDGAVSRLVLHHVPDPGAFVRAVVARVRPGGAVAMVDHCGDPEPAAAGWHQAVERGRDRSHTRNLTPGELVDLLAAAGLRELTLAEEEHTLDFDEWFDRGTPAMAKDEVRLRLLAGTARTFAPRLAEDGSIAIRTLWSSVRGVVPEAS